jgi:2-dehydro-3-deoxy-D-pentonate aldolase
MTQTNLQLGGIIPPMITPLKSRDEIDHPGLERLIEHILAGGVRGVFILGTTGEAPSLGYRLRKELIRKVCELVKGRVPVLVGITDTAFVESVALATEAADAGAAAVVLATPYYFPAGQTELIGYVRRLNDQLPLPLILYNMPSLTKVWFEIETLGQLADLDNIVGLKDSSGDLAYFERAVGLKKIRPDWPVLIGPEALLPDAMRLGGDGGVNGGANVLPRLFADCHEACRSGDAARLAQTHAKIVAFQSVYDIGKYASRHIKATKCCLSLMNICDDFMAEPFDHFFEPERQRVRTILEEHFPESLT